jgi:hypothetical protein
VKGFIGLISRITSNYPGLRRGSLFILFSLLWIASARAQLSRVDSLLAQSVVTMIQPLSPDEIAISSDSLLYPLVAVMPHAMGTCLPTFFIDHLFAIVYNADSANSEMDVELNGVLLIPGSPRAKNVHLGKNVSIKLTSDERRDFHQKHRLGQFVWEKQYRFLSEDASSDHSFWSRVLEPALVIVGATAIVALFFLLRS